MSSIAADFDRDRSTDRVRAIVCESSLDQPSQPGKKTQESKHGPFHFIGKVGSLRKKARNFSTGLLRSARKPCRRSDEPCVTVVHGSTHVGDKVLCAVKFHDVIQHVPAIQAPPGLDPHFPPGLHEIEEVVFRHTTLTTCTDHDRAPSLSLYT
jgi:hypothetical protein